jgi:transposase
VGFQIGGGMIHFGEQWRFAMSVPVALRTDFTRHQLRALAKQSKDAAFARRLLSLAEIFDGGSRSDAARIGGVGLQTIRDWVLRFNAKGPEGLKDGKAPGQPSLLKDEHRRALAQKIEDGPNPAADGVVRWRLIDLAQWIFEDYRISVTKQILSRELRAMGYRKLSARPRHHAQDAAAVAAFKKTSLPLWRLSPRRRAASR